MNDKQNELINLKKETCDLIEKSNATCLKISELNRALSKSNDEKLIEEREALTTVAKAYSTKIFKNYDAIVILEKKLNGREIDPFSPLMTSILYDWQNKPNL